MLATLILFSSHVKKGMPSRLVPRQLTWGVATNFHLTYVVAKESKNVYREKIGFACDSACHARIINSLVNAKKAILSILSVPAKAYNLQLSVVSIWIFSATYICQINQAAILIEQVSSVHIFRFEHCTRQST